MFNQLSHLEWQLTRRDTFADLTIQWVEERWSDLWSLHTRLNNCRRNVDVVLDTLEPGDPNKWTNTRKDFKSIELRLLQLKVKSDALINSFVGLASIVNSRQSFLEARILRFLTILGMIFLPLSFTSGLFSMAGSFSPGGAQFWIYFAVAVPLTVLIFSVPTFFALWYVKFSEHFSSLSSGRVKNTSRFSKFKDVRRFFQEV
jgi:Mg2+ and Co2+ transporter CorA